MKTLTPFKAFFLSFIFVGLPLCLSAQLETVRQYAKLGDTTTLNYPEIEAETGISFQWVKPNMETEATGANPGLFLDSVVISSAGIYELQSFPDSFPNDITIRGLIDLDLLCQTNQGDGPGCFVCRELVVRSPTPEARLLAEEFILSVEPDLIPVETCRCDSVILFRSDAFINTEGIVDQAESMPMLQDSDFSLNFFIEIGPAPDSLIGELNGFPIKDTTSIIINCPDPDSVKVAIIDSGIERVHGAFSSTLFWENIAENSNPSPDSDGNWYINDSIGYDFVNRRGGNFPYSDGHGTHLAGIISRVTRLNPTPTSQQLRIMDLKFYEPRNSTLFNAVCAMYYAIDKRANVMNLSWGYYHDGVDTILLRVLTEAQNADIVVVASAGNRPQNNDNDDHWPSNHTIPYDNMLAVGAASLVNNSPVSYEFAYQYSNYGPTTVDVLAPGTFIESTYPMGGFAERTGTSMAAAYVSMVAALGRAGRPDLTAEQIVSCITMNLFPVPAAPEPFIPFPMVIHPGVVNVQAALDCIKNLPIATEEVQGMPPLAVFPQPFTDLVTINLSAFAFQEGEFRLFHSSGQLITQKTVIAGALENLEFSNLPRGTYYYLIRLEEGLFSGKLIKQ